MTDLPVYIVNDDEDDHSLIKDAWRELKLKIH